MKNLALVSFMVLISLAVFGADNKSPESLPLVEKDVCKTDVDKKVSDVNFEIIQTEIDICVSEKTEVDKAGNDFTACKGNSKSIIQDSEKENDTLGSGSYYDIFSEIECVKPIVTIMIWLT